MSISRIVLGITAALLYWYDFRKAGVIIGFIAGMSDYADGWIARKMGTVSELGAILDRLSDLIFEFVAFVVALKYDVPAFVFVLYIIREVTVNAVRQYVGEAGSTIPSSIFGKLKTNFISYALLLMFIQYSGYIENGTALDIIEYLWKGGLGVGIALSYISGFQYVRSFAQVYNQQQASS